MVKLRHIDRFQSNNHRLDGSSSPALTASRSQSIRNSTTF